MDKPHKKPQEYNRSADYFSEAVNLSMSFTALRKTSREKQRKHKEHGVLPAVSC